MHFNILLFLLSVLVVPSEPTTTYALEVTIENIETISGSIRICLIGGDKDKYLKSCDLSKVVKVQNSKATTTFEYLPKGVYCVYAYHDVDDDQKLSRNGLFGLPSEPYGFSNNPKSYFGPPKFDKCKFTFENDMRITIKL